MELNISLDDLLNEMTGSKPVLILLTLASGAWYKTTKQVSNRWLIPALLVIAPVLEFGSAYLTNGFKLTDPLMTAIGNSCWGGFQDVCVSQFLYQLWKTSLLGQVLDESFKKRGEKNANAKQ